MSKLLRRANCEINQREIAERPEALIIPCGYDIITNMAYFCECGISRAEMIIY